MAGQAFVVCLNPESHVYVMSYSLKEDGNLPGKGWHVPGRQNQSLTPQIHSVHFPGTPFSVVKPDRPPDEVCCLLSLFLSSLQDSPLTDHVTNM